MKSHRLLPLALSFLVAGAGAFAADPATTSDAPNRAIPTISPANAARVDAALPAQASAAPKKPRLILVSARTEGFFHASIPTGLYAIEKLGEKTGAFRVEVNHEMAAFTPENLKRFDGILFLNTTQLKFQNPAHRQALIDFVRSGKGLIGIHAASDNFPGWLEGQALMGGVFHSHPWVASDTVAVKLDEPDHVLNRAFGGRGFWIPEEIYQIVGPYSREKQRVLTSLDMSKPQNERPASRLVRADRDFPIGWVKKEGAGRVFYSSLGHNDQTFWTPEVLRQYLDGIQYALGDLDAPDSPSSQLSPTPKPALAPLEPVALLERQDAQRLHSPELLDRLAAYQEGDDTAVLKSVDSGIRQADAAARARFEQDLLALGARPALSLGAKKEISKWLSRIGSERAVPLLAQWAADAASADPAIRALAEIPGAAADDALIRLAGSGPDAAKPAVLSALSLRRTSAAVPAVAALLTAPQPATVAAAIDCLARIASVDALTALRSFQAPAALQDARAWALLRAASTLSASGNSDGAAELRTLLASAPAGVHKIGAAEALLRTTGTTGLDETRALLDSPDTGAWLAPIWLRAAASEAQSPALASLIKHFSGLASPVQEALLHSAAQLARPSLVALAEQALHSADRGVHLAALEALGACGARLEDARPLIAALENKDDRSAAIDALSHVRVREVDGHLRGLYAQASPETKAALLEIASNRVDRASLGVAFEAAGGSQPALRQAGFRAIRVLAQGSDLPQLFALQSKLKSAAERRLWTESILNAVRARADIDAVSHLLGEQLGKAAPENRPTFIAALTALDSDQADAVIQRLLQDDSVDRRKEVVRALSSARNVRAAKQLIAVAEKPGDEAERILALRGFVDTYVALTEPRPSEKIEAYQRAWKAAFRQEEREAVIAAMEQVESEEGRRAAQALRAQLSSAAAPATRTP